MTFAFFGLMALTGIAGVFLLAIQDKWSSHNRTTTIDISIMAGLTGFTMWIICFMLIIIAGTTPLGEITDPPRWLLLVLIIGAAMTVVGAGLALIDYRCLVRRRRRIIHQDIDWYHQNCLLSRQHRLRR